MKKVRHFINMLDYSDKEIKDLIDLAIKIKKNPKKYSKALQGKSLGMLFQKTSTRTRVSFEAGMTQLGGHAIYLDWRNTNFTLGSIADEIKSLCRYVDGIMFRAYKNMDVVEAADASRVPLINGLDEMYHPCQALADLMTIKEYSKNFKKTVVTYMGDGNNVCNSLIIACAKLGVKINVVTPIGYEPSKIAVDLGKKKGVLTISHDPKAAWGSDFVYTDTWVSMGQEADSEKRIKDFAGFQVDKKALGNAYFMHCLPAHRGYEVSNEVIDSEKSIVFDQAENRMHAQKALLLTLLK